MYRLCKIIYNLQKTNNQLIILNYLSKFTDIEIFDLLKKEITKEFFTTNSASSDCISEWKGQDIISFQDDVFSKTKSTVSEKWFYTYFKSEFKKLPRIDMLNILAQYVGYSNWNDFVRKKTEEFNGGNVLEENQDLATIKEEIKDFLIEEKIEKKINSSTPSKPKSNKPLIGTLIVLGLLSIVGIVMYFAFFHQKVYEFCFIDSDRNTSIKDPIEVKILRKDFTPLDLIAEEGCIKFPSKEDTIYMYVSSPYHKSDTFKINLHQYQNRENIRLEPDDYKVMLRHYSKSSQSVKERISMLDQMIADDALIYQVYDNEYFGVEVLSKKQYINLVSLPTSSLKNFTLIDAERKNGKIVKLKFKIQSNENQ